MNYALAMPEMLVVALGLGLLLADLWTPVARKRSLGYVAAIGLGVVFLWTFSATVDADQTQYAFAGAFVQDGFALYCKRLFLAAGVLVLVVAVEFSDQLRTGLTEYYALLVLAVAGMMFAASAHDFSLVFVAVEFMTVTFYVLTSYQRGRVACLEAGVKYLILGALASAFLVFGIAFVFGTTGSLNFAEIARRGPQRAGDPLFLAGLVLVLLGLGFKIAAFPLQLWAPDVYQGSPTPTTALLAIGSKAAGFALLLRVLCQAVPDLAGPLQKLLIGVAGLTILYGNLCALPQRNVKRLLGYSSIANAGYLLIGVAALGDAGQAAVLFYLAGYLFAVVAAFAVICVVMRQLPSEDVGGLAGLGQRAPFLAATLALAMVSLAGIPPLVGFFGKFLLVKAALAQGATEPWLYGLVVVAIGGVVMSLYYYFGIIRAMYWSTTAPPDTPLPLSRPLRVALGGCALAMLVLGVSPQPVLAAALRAAQSIGI